MVGVERVTRQLLDLLAVLLAAHLRGEELHGYAMMKRAGLTGPSTYRSLDRLEDADLVDARWEELPAGDERPRRCYYRLNHAGAAVARKLLAERRPAVLKQLGPMPPDKAQELRPVPAEPPSDMPPDRVSAPRPVPAEPTGQPEEPLRWR
jgi:PadR family transcriptional regulator